MNCTITEMAQCMLENKSIPKKFWVGAVYKTIYLLNRSLTQAEEEKTPKEAWSRRKPKVSHLNIFGSTTYVWIPDAKRTKLDSKSQKLMLKGYIENQKAYRLIDVNTDLLTFNRNMVIDEEVGPFNLSSDIKTTEDQPPKVKD